jgi:hypothetical protein
MPFVRVFLTCPSCRFVTQTDLPTHRVTPSAKFSHKCKCGWTGIIPFSDISVLPQP